MKSLRIASLALASLGALGCVGTTGGDLFTFDAAAAGPTAASNHQLEFMERDYDVVLTKATLHVGAVYLNDTRPISGEQATSCVLPGVYVAEVTNALDVDLLDPTPQPFPGKGESIGEHALDGEVWLTHGDVDIVQDDKPILILEGVATRPGEQYTFEGTLTIGGNRLPMGVEDPAMPSAHPICKERIVSPVPLDFTPKQGGALLMRVDPRGMFTNVDFSLLPKKVTPKGPVYQFRDNDNDPASLNLYRGLQAKTGVYFIEWESSSGP